MSIAHAPERDVPAVRKLISKRGLLDLIPKSYPWIWKEMRAGRFPLPVKLGDGPNAPNAWYADEIAEHQANLKRATFKPLTEREALVNQTRHKRSNLKNTDTDTAAAHADDQAEAPSP